mmetsp:Transcript_30394/g.55811  ORF Transcript_30394/g.55811 Transcript_30394/m.55811 type:complete len:281 (-) Transcript_30394:745-1587(-)
MFRRRADYASSHAAVVIVAAISIPSHFVEPFGPRSKFFGLLIETPLIFQSPSRRGILLLELALFFQVPNASGLCIEDMAINRPFPLNLLGTQDGREYPALPLVPFLVLRIDGCQHRFFPSDPMPSRYPSYCTSVVLARVPTRRHRVKLLGACLCPLFALTLLLRFHFYGSGLRRGVQGLDRGAALLRENGCIDRSLFLAAHSMPFRHSRDDGFVVIIVLARIPARRNGFHFFRSCFSPLPTFPFLLRLNLDDSRFFVFPRCGIRLYRHVQPASSVPLWYF